MIKTIDQVLADFRQIEEPRLTATQEKILDLLRVERKPMLAKTISRRLLLDYNSVRARLHELSRMGFVYQPDKVTRFISLLPSNGKAKDVKTTKSCGYKIVRPGQWS